VILYRFKNVISTHHYGIWDRNTSVAADAAAIRELQLILRRKLVYFLSRAGYNYLWDILLPSTKYCCVILTQTNYQLYWIRNWSHIANHLVVVIVLALLLGCRSSKKRNTHDIRSKNRRRKSTPFFLRRFLQRVSYKSGTWFVWYQKPASIRTLFYFQARNWRARNWNDELSPVIVYFYSFHFL